MDWVAVVIQAVVGGLITGGAAFVAIRVELRWLRSDINDNKKGIARAHVRIDEMSKKVWSNGAT